MSPRPLISLVLVALALVCVQVATARDPFSRIEAEDMDYNVGISTEPTTDVDGGMDLRYVHNGDVVGYYKMDFRTKHPSMISIRASRSDNNGVGYVNVHFNLMYSTPAAVVEVYGNPNYETFNASSLYIPFDDIWTDYVDVYLVFSSNYVPDYPGVICGVNWFVFY